MSAFSPLPLLATPVKTHDVKPEVQATHVERIDSKAVREVPKSHTNIETVALVVKEPKAEFDLQTVILDEVRPDELLIEMKYSGICESELLSWSADRRY